MRALVLVVLTCGSAWGAEAVRAENCSGRGWLTGAGLAIAGGGAIALSTAAYQAALAESSGRAVASYYARGAAPTAREAPAVRWLHERTENAMSQALALLIGGAVGVAVGIGLVLFDGWRGQPTVMLAIQPSGTSVVLSGRF